MRFADAIKMFKESSNYVKLIKEQHNGNSSATLASANHFEFSDILFT